MEQFDILRIIKFLPGIIIGLTVHEFCHAWMAERCGDSTAKDQGRVSLNPLKHIDPLGFIMLIVAGFGWAKPVQFNEHNLRNPSTDVIKIAVAGPISNALLAMILSVLFSFFFSNNLLSLDTTLRFVMEMFLYAIYINWGLFIFNLIPIPPLDGSHLFFFPLRKYTNLYQALYKYGMWVLFILIMIENTTKSDIIPLGSMIKYMGDGFLKVVMIK